MPFKDDVLEEDGKVLEMVDIDDEEHNKDLNENVIEDPKSKLLQELKGNRDGLHTILGIIKTVRDKLDAMAPTQNDYRNRNLVKIHMESISSIVRTELDVRKQIDSSIKTEYDIREKEDTGVDSNNISIADIAKAMSKLKKVG